VLLSVNALTEVALIEWQAGARRLEQAELSTLRRAVLNAVVAEIVGELQRRLGTSYTLDRLAGEYAEAAGWCLDVAQRTTELPFAYDLSLVQDAAFHWFARNASDFR
jgi:hypothetical protein